MVSRTLIISLCLTWACVPSVARAVGSGRDVNTISLLNTDSRSVRFEYRPGYAKLGTLREKGQQYTVVDFDEALLPNGGTVPGVPDLRTRSFGVAFPGPAGNSVTVVAADYEETPGIRIAPVPRYIGETDLADSVEYRQDPASYAKGSFLPGTVASLGPIERSGDQWLGNVVIAPVQWNPATGVLRRYSRVVVEVTFGPASPLRALRAKPNPLNPRILNASSASGWKLPAALPKAAPQSSVLATGEWFKIPVTERGMYRISASYLSSLGITLSTLDPRTLKIYGGNGSDLPENVAVPRPLDLPEHAILVTGESDGKFDPTDALIFYGQGARGWAYDPGARVQRHEINHYSETNYYWLTYGGAPGKRMQSQPSPPATGTEAIREQFTDYLSVEEEKSNLLSSGKDWLGPSLTAGQTTTYVQALPGLISGDVIRYRCRVLAQSSGAPQFEVKQSGTTLGSTSLWTISGYAMATAALVSFTGTSTLASGTSQVSFTFKDNVSTSKGFVDWLEFSYPRMLWGVNDSLHFWGPDTAAMVEYRLQEFTGEPAVYDVSTDTAVVLITGVTGSYTFRAAATAGSQREYWAVGQNSYRTPAGASRVANQDLHGYADGADFIILTGEEDRGAADQLKAWRENPAHGGLKTIVVDVNQVYNEFAGGIPDITAIRDYLYYAYRNWSPRPQYVLLFGQCSFDYKGILGTPRSVVPTWQSIESLDDVNSYSSDDFFVMFSGSWRPDMVIGRVNARSSQEAQVFVDKLRGYESSSAPDAWKSRILFVADDAWTPELGECGDQTLHGDDIEGLATSRTPAEIEKKKVFLAEYPTVYVAQGRRKPEAAQAIINGINAGALIVDYAGHGNPTQLAHENVFNVATSVPELVNADRLSVFVLATCNFSQSDNPTYYSGGEYLINLRGGGAIGVIAGTRKVYANYNRALNWGTFQILFASTTVDRLVTSRPAYALTAFKQSSGNSVNDQKYFFMGDPTMQLQNPAGYATIDTINGASVRLDNGIPRTSPITMRSLAEVTVKGSVRDENGIVDSTFSGVITMVLNDVTQTHTIVDYFSCNGVESNFFYQASGGVLYRGQSSITRGEFVAKFLVPKDIQYADSTLRGRLTGYFAQNGMPTNDGLAFTSMVRMAGADSTAVNDGAGPSITISLGNKSFRPGDAVGTAPLLLVDLADSSGINTSVTGIGHRIEAWLNDGRQSVDLTDAYTSSLDNFRRGTVTYQLSGLPEGKNTIRVRAWDSFNNSATAEVDFDVASTDRLSVTNVLNYPNPFAGGGTLFTFRQNLSEPLKVLVKVFTVTGRLVQTLETQSSGDSFVRVPWDGRDRDGDAIANGVYLYKLTVSTYDGRFTSQTLGKIAKLE
jgi:hypothetical protein